MFRTLINHPPINQIIILEDSISVIEDTEEAFAKYCVANEETRNRINNDCKKINRTDLSEILLLLYTEIAAHITEVGDQHDLLNKGITKFAHSKNVKSIHGNVGRLGLEYGNLKECFKKRGVANYTPDYESISLSEIIYSTTLPISIFDSNGPEAFNEITNLINDTKGDFSKWTLLIVDKKLKTGGDGIAIAKSIIENSLNDNIPVASVVYTSSFSEREHKNISDFFIIEVSKSSPDKFTELSSALSKSAYVFIYDYITKCHKHATDQAFELVRNNSENIFNLISGNIREGFSTLEAILLNFNLTHSLKFDKLLFGSGDNYFNLSIGFKQAFNNSDGLSKSSSDLKEINCFEIFDYRVNEKLLPIDNGDIFEIEGKYYVLVGQTCDLAIREQTNKRKNRNAELIPAKFIKEISTNKYTTYLTPSERRVEIGFFENDNNETGKLILSINELKYCDFSILDLCSFSRSGNSILYLNDDSSEKEINRYIPQRSVYFNDLKQYASKIIKIDPTLREFASNDFNIWHYKYNEEGSIVNWRIKRICRIKGDFSKALFNEFINHKQRLALNLILPAEVHNMKREIIIRLPYPSSDKRLFINSWESGGIEYIKRDEVFALLEGTEIKVIDYIQLPAKLEIKNTKDYDLIVNAEDNSFELILPFFCEPTNKIIKKLIVKASELGFNGEELINEDGSPVNMAKIDLSEIKSGFKIKDTKKILTIDGGIITLNNEN